MNTIKKTLLLLTIVLSTLTSLFAESQPEDIKILFFGNSFTFTNELPNLVKEVVELGQPGVTVTAERITYPGNDMFRHYNYYFSQSFVEEGTITEQTIQERIDSITHFKTLTQAPNAEEYSHYWNVIGQDEGDFTRQYFDLAITRHQTLLAEIKVNDRTTWDYLVLQSWRDDMVDDEGYALYAKELAKVAQAQGIKVILYMTAPYIQNSHAVASPVLPQRAAKVLKVGHDLATDINAFAVIPVPLAMNIVQQDRSDLTFCYVNDYHPNQRCGFLTANMFYSALTGESAEGLAFDRVKRSNQLDPDGNPGLLIFETEERDYLQAKAHEAVTLYNTKYDSIYTDISTSVDAEFPFGESFYWASEVGNGVVTITDDNKATVQSTSMANADNAQFYVQKSSTTGYVNLFTSQGDKIGYDTNDQALPLMVTQDALMGYDYALINYADNKFSLIPQAFENKGRVGANSVGGSVVINNAAATAKNNKITVFERLDSLVDLGGIPYGQEIVLKSLGANKFVGVDRTDGDKLYAKTDSLSLTEDNVFTIITSPADGSFALLLSKEGENVRVYFNAAADKSGNTLASVTGPYDTNNTRFLPSLIDDNKLCISQRSYPDNWMRYDATDSSIDMGSTIKDDNSTFVWYLVSDVMGEGTSATVELESKSLFIYPTVVESTFSVSGTSVTNVAIYSLNGSKMKQATVSSNRTVDVSELSNGVYLVDCSQGAMTDTFKILKK